MADNRILHYLKPRSKDAKSTNTQIITYNKDSFLRLQEIAKRNKTTASAIISNFIDCFVEYFDEKPVTLDQFLDPEYVAEPAITEPAISKIVPFLKKQDTRTLEYIDENSYMTHVFARVLSRLPPDQRKTLTDDYPYVWRTFYK
jgi:hypothetical protein